MASKVEKSATSTAAVLVTAVFVLNWLSAQYWSYPFAWCVGKAVLQPVLEPWLFVIHFLALAYFCACAWSGEVLKMVKGLMVVVFWFGLPTFSEILLRLGKNCN